MSFFSRSQDQGHGDGSRKQPTVGQSSSDDVNTNDSLETSALYPKCALCAGYIQNIVVQALDKTWHPEHFLCSHCHVPISTQKFYVYQDNPYCVEDFANLYLKKCHGCKLPIKDVVVTALNRSWHQDHFVCVACGCKLLQKGFYEKEDNAFCTECYEGKFCPKCCECYGPIIDMAVRVHTRRWHEACFKCGQCGQLLPGPTGEPFRLNGGEVLCVHCAEGRKFGKNDTGRNEEDNRGENEGTQKENGRIGVEHDRRGIGFFAKEDRTKDVRKSGEDGRVQNDEMRYFGGCLSGGEGIRKEEDRRFEQGSKEYSGEAVNVRSPRQDRKGERLGIGRTDGRNLAATRAFVHRMEKADIRDSQEKPPEFKFSTNVSNFSPLLLEGETTKADQVGREWDGSRYKRDGIFSRMADYIGRMEEDLNVSERGRPPMTEGRGDCVRYFDPSDVDSHL